jgi:hypothetical protein
VRTARHPMSLSGSTVSRPRRFKGLFLSIPESATNQTLEPCSSPHKRCVWHRDPQQNHGFRPTLHDTSCRDFDVTASKTDDSMPPPVFLCSVCECSTSLLCYAILCYAMPVT